MKADYQSYKRAAGVSLLGLALQLAMGFTLLIYAFVAQPQRDAVALAGSLSILLGSMVWLVLAIVFDQHRRERIEQMELEAMTRSGAREASAFSEGGDDLRVAHKRLVWMHKVFVPVASLVYAAALGGVGAWLYVNGKRYLAVDAFQSTTSFGVVISLELGVAFVGFVFARYVAGMAKQPMWSHLRAGAGVAVGASVFGLLAAIGQFVDYVGPQEPIKYMHVVWPAIMVVLAVEVVLSFLMGMYSPRKPGEFPRAALDSKIMSFVAAPDRIAASIGEALNYQFGFDVTGNWFYQLFTRSATLLVMAGVVVVWLLSCIAVVQPNEQGIRVRLGERVGPTLGPGPYLKAPWPFEEIETFQTTAARRLDLGGPEPKVPGNKAILWTNDHGVGTEKYFIVRLTANVGESADVQGKGLALATVEVPLYYRVTDYDKFNAIGMPDQRDEILASIGRREAFRMLAERSMGEVLGEGREELSRALRERVSRKFAEKDCGVEVLFVGIEGVHPPRETAAAFEDVVRAEHRANGARENARKEANAALISVAGSVEQADEIARAITELRGMQDGGRGAAADVEAKQRQVEELLARAGGTAAAAIQRARAERWDKHMSVKAMAEQYEGQTAGFKAAPSVYTAKTYFETLALALKDTRVYIVEDDGSRTHLRINLEDIDTGGSIFLKPKKEE